ncbi:winged helix-turn-helix domain-containing protein [Aestuariibacter sp. AA17]|uniref:Winged helix-turn-helix domain-containing protein n=1 Tax=Fluctibacter corallii TaxID=2984329 RepID=A0ABT3A835_9ALTE|nr:winged helix-turn-helix domain-containing protein [Aestuariibacter sp. AA17]MCV2884845.1 winged helix-turn-helix domain-containing protein [Aestuariibacter sp. AA17]
MDSRQFYLGDWHVIPSSNTLQREKCVKTLEPKAMEVLVALCLHAGEVLSAENLIDICWGDADVGDNPIHKAITQLRKALGDKAASPTFIETIRKRGYRIIAPVELIGDENARASSITWDKGSPFVGLNAFSPEQADVFFGRHQPIQQLLDNLLHLNTLNHTFSLLLGPSGSGKSSLVQAGLLPRLCDPKGVCGMQVVAHTTIDFADTRAEQLWLDLASCLLDWDIDGEIVFADQSAEQLATRIADYPEVVAQRCRAVINGYKAYSRQPEPRLFLFLDRLEVALDAPQYTDSVRSHLFTFVDALAQCGAVVVFAACRNDFYPQITQYPTLMAHKLQGAHFDLLPPTSAELSQMIRLPAIAAGLRWEKSSESGQSLDDILCLDAANHPDALPLLQYTLNELYLQRQDEVLTYNVYENLGGLEGAIGSQADKLIASFSEREERALEQIFALLITLSPDGSNVTSRTAKWSELQDEHQRQVVQIMVENRLFVSLLQQGQPGFRIAHEALLRRWPRMQDWLSHHRESLAIKSRLLSQTQQWLRESKDSAYLLQEGKPLQEANDLAAEGVLAIQADEQALVNASNAKVAVKRWVTRITAAVLVVLTLSSVLMGMQSYVSYQMAEKKREDAENLLGFMVGEFADKLRSVKRMDLLDGISNRALAYFTEQEQTNGVSWWPFNQQFRSFEAQFHQAQTLQAIAEVAYSRDKIDEATEGFKHAEAQYLDLYEDHPENIDIVKALGVNAFWLGQIAYDGYNNEGAKEGFTRYLTYSQRLNELTPDDVDAWIELSYALNSLGSVYIELSEYEKAHALFTQSLSLKQKAVDAMPNDTDLIVNLADTYSWLGSTKAHVGKTFEGIASLQTAIDILVSFLEQNQGNALAIESLFLTLNRQLDLLLYLERSSDALPILKRTLSLVESLRIQDPEDFFWKKSELKLISEFLRVPSDDKEFYASKLQHHVDSKVFYRSPNAMLNFIEYLQHNQQWRLSASVMETLHFWLDENYQDSFRYSVKLARYHILSAMQSNNGLTNEERLSLCKKSHTILDSISKKSANIKYSYFLKMSQRCISQLTKINGDK